MQKEDGPLIGTRLQGSACNIPAQPSRIARVKREMVPERPERLCGHDEDLVCDLTGSNAKWEVRKKPRAEEVILL